jgi:hypothetical protein
MAFLKKFNLTDTTDFTDVCYSYGVFNLTPSIVFRFADSTSPLHMERGGEMLDYRSDEGVRLE